MLRAGFVRRAAAAAALLLTCTTGAEGWAQTPPPPPQPLTLEGDPSRGEVLAYTCTGCHGVDGYRNAYPSFHVPKIGGQNADYIEVALQAYRNGLRPHPTMQAQGSALADQDIADLATYFADHPGEPQTGTSGADPTAVQAGRQKSIACVPCHGADGVAQAPQWPTLAGQHASYLRHALGQYKSGARTDALMAPMVTPLDDEALDELAAYYAAQPGLRVSEP